MQSTNYIKFNNNINNNKNNNNNNKNNNISNFKNNNYNQQNHNICPYRKTSAEIISEAKNMLAGGGGCGSTGIVGGNIGGARLVSTRRPITPREPKRQLYGKQAPPGRPPSSFSLRYLQFESRVLPSLEPLSIVNKSSKNKNLHSRSGSLGLIISSENDHNSNNNRIQGKLPALLMPPKLSGSLDNLSEEMPPRKDFKPKDDQIITNDNKKTNSTTFLLNVNRKSIDENMPPIETILKTHDKMINKNKCENRKNIKTPMILSKTLLFKTNDLLVQSSTETLLDMLKDHAGIKECTEETVLHINGILNELYTRVKGAHGDWRSAVLGALYGLVECVSPKVLLSVARVVLVLCVTGSNLTGACKLVFKIARNEVNDNLFVDSDVPELLIDGLGRATPLDEPEACIYGYSAVRFLANPSLSTSSTSTSLLASTSSSSLKFKDIATKNTVNLIKQKSLAQRLAKHGAIQLMILHLQMLNEAGATVKLTGPPLHALFQLSGALRALANIPLLNSTIHSNLLPPSLYSVTTKTINNNNNNNNTNVNNYPKIKEILDEQDCQLDLAGPHLVRAAEICIGENEIQANLIRTLSVLSENEICCEVLSDSVARIGILLGPCNDSTKNIPEKSLGVISRLGYILGNIMARFDTARNQFFTNDVAMEYLLDTLELYSNKTFNNRKTIDT